MSSARPGKVDAVVSNVARLYHTHRDLELTGDGPGGVRGGFQIVFCDLGTPDAGGGSAVYGKIRAGLIAAGVPRGQIRFIHEAGSDSQKSALFADCRAGKVAVLLGSTDKLGVGTNIQTRCVALHHLDAPWRPADVEQREGRAVRPGNLNALVEIFQYVSERSFDSFMWQTLERKAKFIGQVLGGRPTGRDVDDIGDATLSFAEVKALATGNPLLLELAEANAQVTRLRQLASGHTRSVRRLGALVAAWQQQISTKTRLAGNCDRIAAVAREHSGEGWRDHLGVPIPGDAVPGHLGALAEQALSSAGYGAVTWRGLRISFSAERQWRQMGLIAAISAVTGTINVELNLAWTAKGQQWRIERELAARVEGAAGEAGRLRADAEDLRRRVADATARINESFPQAAELEAARVRRDAIEQQIRDAAASSEQDTDPPAGPDVDQDAEPAMSDLAYSGLDGDHEVTIFTPETAFVFDPGTPIPAGPVLSPAPAISPAANASIGPAADEQTGEAEPVANPAAAATLGEAVTPEPARTTPPSIGSRLPSDMAGEPEPLFALSQPVPSQQPEDRTRRAPPLAARSPSRRPAPQLAAQDGAPQPALFDLPPAPAPAPGRKPAHRNRASTPRK